MVPRADWAFLLASKPRRLNVATLANLDAHMQCWALSMQVAAGTSVGLFDIRASALFQTLVGDEQLGRTIAARDSLRMASKSASALLAGALPVLIGVAGSFGAFGWVGAVISVAAMTRLSSRVLAPLGAGERHAAGDGEGAAPV
jgi:hypothetical protein